MSLSYVETQILNDFILEKASESKSINRNTEHNYKYILFEFWMKKAQERGVSIKDLSIRDIRNIKNKLMKAKKEETDERKYSNNTIIKYLNVLSSYYEFLKQDDFIKDNPVKKITFPPVPNRKEHLVYLKDDEIEYLVRMLSKIDRNIPDYYQENLVILFPIITGVRVFEESNLTLDRIDFDTGEVLVFGKGSKQRPTFIPFDDQYIKQLFYNHLKERKDRLDNLINLYEKRIERAKKFNRDFKKYENKIELFRDCNYLFVNRCGNKLSVRDIQRRVKKYRLMFHITKRITPHKLRHTFASKLVREKVDIFHIKELLGHTNIQTTQIYLHTDSEDLRKTIEKNKPFKLDFMINDENSD